MAAVVTIDFASPGLLAFVPSLLATVFWRSQLKSLRLSRFSVWIMVASLLMVAKAFATPIPTTTTLTVPAPGTVSYGNVAVLTATVTDSNNAPVLRGTVTFSVGSTTIGTAQLVATSSGGFTPGTATFRWRSLINGSVTAVFNGTNTDATSTSAAQSFAFSGSTPANPTQTSLTYSGLANGQYVFNASSLGVGLTLPFTGNVTFTDTTTGDTLGIVPITPGTTNPYASPYTFMTTPSPVPSQCTQVVAAGDFNNDGRPDLVTASPSADNSCTPGDGVLTVLLGNGDGTFTPSSSSYTGLLNPHAMAVGDFNADGNLDVIVNQLTTSGPQLLVFLGNGDGSFQAPLPITFAAGHEPAAVVVGDFNTDGILDLATARISGADLTAEVSILFGNGDGTFAAPTSIPFTFPGPAQSSQDTAPWVSLAYYAPYNDLAMPVGTELAVISGNVYGVFAAPVLYADGDTSETSGGVTYAQVGVSIAISGGLGDNDEDYIVESRGDSPPAPLTPLPAQTSIFTIGIGRGNYGYYTRPLPTLAGGPSPVPGSLIVSDLLYDPYDADIVTTYNGVPQLTAEGDLELAPFSQLIPTPGYTGVQLAAADFRGDGSNGVAAAAQNGIDLAEVAQSGTAGLSLSTLPGGPGLHKVVATFSPGPDNPYFTPSTSNAVIVVVNAVTLTSNLPANTEAVFGAEVQFTATVQTINDVAAPTGTVQFYDGTTAVGAPIALSNGAATFSSSSFSAGAHSVTAAYSGDSNYAMSTSSALSFTVLAQGPDTVTLAPLAVSTAYFGTPFTINGTLTTGALGPPPTGAVQLLDNGQSIASAALSGNSPIPLTFQVNTASQPLPVGTHSFNLSYPGVTPWVSSTSSSAAVTVSQTPVALLLTYSPVTPTKGATITFTASISGQVGTVLPTGTVQFYDGTSVLGGPITLVNGSAAYSTNSLAVGYHEVSADYSGNTDYESRGSQVLEVFVQWPSSVSITSNLPPSGDAVSGANILITAAALSSSGLTPTGTIQFYDRGAPVGAPVALSVYGTAILSSSSFSVGPHSITAAYSGDVDNAMSTSAALAFTVFAQGPDTLVLSPPALSTTTLGAPFNLSGTLTAGALGPAPTGTIELLDNGSVIGSAAVTGASPYSATFAVNTPRFPLLPGSHSLSLKYLGSTLWAASLSNTVMMTINPAPTGTTIWASRHNLLAGTPITLVAKVTGQIGRLEPGGTIQFGYEGGLLGSPVPLIHDMAVYTTRALPPGTHTVGASYSGNSNYLMSYSTPWTVTVSDFGLNAGSSTLTMSAGGFAATTLTVTTEGEFDQSVRFECAGLPMGAVCLFRPQIVRGGGTTMLTIFTPDDRPGHRKIQPGTYNIVVTATTAPWDFAVRRSVTLKLVVN